MPKKKITGVLLLDKAKGLSSNTALQQVKKLFNAAKAGHTGTLDPMATGLLPICLGEATKYAGTLTHGDKSYVATLKFGEETTTGDAEGEVIATADRPLTREEIMRVLPEFMGEIEQTPPLYSALKVAGRPLYAYARSGEEVERESRKIVVKQLELVDFSYPLATLAVHCGKGTYIRVLAEDIARRLGHRAHLTDLRRVSSCHFELHDAYTFSYLQSLSAPEREALLLPSDALLKDLPRVTLGEEDVLAIRQGKNVHFVLNYEIITRLSLYSGTGAFLGLGEYSPEKGAIKAIRLMSTG